jgi:arylsulfatase A-like enzyme
VGGALSLLHTPFAELSIPDHNRPDGKPPPEAVPLEGDLRVASGTTGRQTYEAPLPFRMRTLFFSVAPPGMAVTTESGDVIPHAKHALPGVVRWSYTANTVRISAPLKGEHLTERRYFLSYPRATEREAVLNFEFSGEAEPEDFVRTAIQDGPVSRTGLLLPAPGVAAWEMIVPPAAELHFAPGLVLPEVRDGPESDGVTLTWEVDRGGTSTTVWKRRLDPGEFRSERVDLSAWAGQDIRLVLRSDPGKSAVFDYAFVGDPQVASRKGDPHRVVMVFVDTLRADHLGTYGYQRQTSPLVDEFASRAVVFDAARSVAPWTLPTARSLMTGRHPELFDSAATLQAQLQAQGWATAMFAGNWYLSPNFGINRDWGQHRLVNWPLAEDQVDQALKWFEEVEGRDAFLMVHFMDPHLPYREPKRYRSLWAKEPPETLGEEFHRNTVLRYRLEASDREYVVDRYDGSIRYVDDEVGRLLEGLEEDDIVIFFSDHGEEFWEHGGFEHGHTLYDEVIRVPLVVRAPGLAPSRVEAPVSLLDLAPTVLDLLGYEVGDVDGLSLVPAMTGDKEALAALAGRDLAFGRPLYGDARWGTLRSHQKYTTTRGREYLYELATDPGETRNRLYGEEMAQIYRGRLANGLGTEVGTGFRLLPNSVSAPPKVDLVAEVHVPGGVKSAWIGDDPTAKSAATISVEGDVVTFTWLAGFRYAREVFIVPEAPWEEAAVGMRVDLTMGPETSSHVMGEKVLRKAITGTLARMRLGGRSVQLNRAIAPIPHADTPAPQGYDAELAEMLRAMGYAVGSEPE